MYIYLIFRSFLSAFVSTVLISFIFEKNFIFLARVELCLHLVLVFVVVQQLLKLREL